MLIVSKLAHPENEESLMVVTPSGMVIVARLVHSENAKRRFY